MRRYLKKAAAVFAAMAMISTGSRGFTLSDMPVCADSAAITSMSYFSANDGPIIEGSGIINASYGFVMPIFNGGTLTFEDAADDLKVNVKVNGEWLDIDSVNYFIYDKTWGHWYDGGFVGFWFIVDKTTEIQLVSKAYPDVTLEYTLEFTRLASDETRPIELGTVNNGMLDGWDMIWSDEFDGAAIDSSKWTHETGYYLTDDPNTWGWGNNELEYYTDSEKNSFVNDGRLTIRLLDEPMSFEQDAGRTAPYSSGKLVSRDKFSFRYGRIDFCARLPVGNGIWPALWMLPNDSVYGTWAASGEIDVMEAKGRVNDTIYGTIHYGGQWPSNTYSGGTYTFDEGAYDDGFHVYSCIWEKENIRWYVDGKCYYSVPYTEWYSAAAPDDQYAPFDEEFYVIMNLAAGGNFDGGIAPDSSAIPGQMEIEYVRVYQAEDDENASFTDNGGGDVNMALLVRLSSWLLGKATDSSGLDVYSDGVIDVYDLVAARKMVTGDT